MTPQPLIPPQAQTPPKRSGCVIALIVAGVLLGLMCLVGGVAAFIAARSETGQKIFSAVGQGVALAEKGINAPGAAELRAAGCQQALVMNMADAMKLAEVFIDGGLKTKDGEFDYDLIACTGDYRHDLPGCDELAPVYARAVSSERDFVIEVKTTGQKKPTCRKRYAGDGTFLRDVDK
jgi:hypothetical protein